MNIFLDKLKDDFLKLTNEEKLKKFNGLKENELLDLCTMVLKMQYSEFNFYKSLRDFVIYNHSEFNSFTQKLFNTLFCIDKTSLSKDLSFFYNLENKYQERIIGLILSGSIRHELDVVIDAVSYKELKGGIRKKTLYFLLSRGVTFEKITEILGDPKIEDKYTFEKPRIKIALLVSGQMRGLESAVKSWSETFDFGSCEIDIFISTWMNGGRLKNYTNIRYANDPVVKKEIEKGEELNIDPNIALARYISPTLITDTYIENILKKYFQYNKLIIDVEDENDFIEFKNPMKLYYKINRCFELSKKEGVYDLYFRIRPDLQIVGSKLDIYALERVLRYSNTIYTHYSYVYEYYGFGVDDKFAIANFQNMDIYSNTWLFDANKKINMQGHVNLANNLFYHKIDVKGISGLSFSILDMNKEIFKK